MEPLVAVDVDTAAEAAPGAACGMVRHWFLQDFCTHCRQNMDCETAYASIRHMSHQLQLREGIRLRQYMYKCWEPEARPRHMFRGVFEEVFLRAGTIPTPQISLSWRTNRTADALDWSGNDPIMRMKLGTSARLPLAARKWSPSAQMRWCRRGITGSYISSGRESASWCHFDGATRKTNRQTAQLVSARRRLFQDESMDDFCSRLRHDIGPLGAPLVDQIRGALETVTSQMATAEDCRNIRRTGAASNPARNLLEQRISLQLGRRLRDEHHMGSELATACTEKFVQQIQGAGYWSVLAHILRVLSSAGKHEFWAWFWEFDGAGAEP